MKKRLAEGERRKTKRAPPGSVSVVATKDDWYIAADILSVEYEAAEDASEETKAAVRRVVRAIRSVVR